MKKLWKKWLKIAHVIGNFQGQVILTVFYFTILAPFALIALIFSDSLNRRKKDERSTFEPWVHPRDTEETARRQF